MKVLILISFLVSISSSTYGQSFLDYSERIDSVIIANSLLLREKKETFFIIKDSILFRNNKIFGLDRVIKIRSEEEVSPKRFKKNLILNFAYYKGNLNKVTSDTIFFGVELKRKISETLYISEGTLEYATVPGNKELKLYGFGGVQPRLISVFPL